MPWWPDSAYIEPTAQKRRATGALSEEAALDLPLRICRENVVLRLNCRMARDPALGVTDVFLIRRERVGRGVIAQLGISPSAAVRESLAILLDETNAVQGVRHIYGKGRLRILFRYPLDLRDLGAVGERLAVAGNAGPVGVDLHGIGDDQLDLFVGLTDGDRLPVLVSPEVREREPARHLHGVLVLRREGYAARDSEQRRNGSHRDVSVLHLQCLLLCPSLTRL